MDYYQGYYRNAEHAAERVTDRKSLSVVEWLAVSPLIVEFMEDRQLSIAAASSRLRRAKSAIQAFRKIGKWPPKVRATIRSHSHTFLVRDLMWLAGRDLDGVDLARVVEQHIAHKSRIPSKPLVKGVKFTAQAEHRTADQLYIDDRLRSSAKVYVDEIIIKGEDWLIEEALKRLNIK